MLPVLPTMSGDIRVPQARNFMKQLVMRLSINRTARKEIADYEVTNPDAETVFVSYGAPARSVEQVIHDTAGEKYRAPAPEDGLAIS